MGDERAALAAALRALSRRDHSETEIRRILSNRKYPPETIEGIIARLREAGYLNDTRFARIFAESAIRNGRGYGMRIRRDLARRGVAEEEIDAALEDLAEEYDEVATLTGLMARKFGDFDPHRADDRQKRRIIGYFQRRGFSLRAIFKVVGNMGGE